jgi:hypothetical protein
MLEGAPADPSPTKALSRSHVAVDEAIASDDVASGAGDELLVHRSVPDEGVELTVLAAWVHVVGEVGEEGEIEDLLANEGSMTRGARQTTMARNPWAMIS